MTDQQNTAAVSDEDTAPQFSLQRIYVRDLSSEAPTSPARFRQQWQHCFLDITGTQYHIIHFKQCTVHTNHDRSADRKMHIRCTALHCLFQHLL